jgi:hypothetical protein
MQKFISCLFCMKDNSWMSDVCKMKDQKQRDKLPNMRAKKNKPKR